MTGSVPPSEDAEALQAVLEALQSEGALGPPPDWLRWLFRPDDAPMDLILASARAAPTQARPWLAAIVGDDELSLEGSVGGGRAPPTAAYLLGELGAADAIPELIGALVDTEEEDQLHGAALDALAEIGPACIEPVLAARAALPPRSYARGRLAYALALLDRPDPRSRAALLETLEEDPEFGAYLCSVSEDPVLIPPLRARWEAISTEDAEGDEDLLCEGHALGQALLDLNAPWTDADAAKYAWFEDRASDGAPDAAEAHDDGCDDPECDRHGHARDEDRWELGAILEDAGRLKRPDGTPVAEPDLVLDPPAEPLVRREAPGRNDPCWCGSGKKYKKCHLDADGG